MIVPALACPAFWGEASTSSLQVLTSLQQREGSVQLTWLDYGWDGQTGAIIQVPLASERDSRLLVCDRALFIERLGGVPVGAGYQDVLVRT
jgi:hypothetical protein